MSANYFVMLYTQRAFAPLMNVDGDDLARFETMKEAHDCAKENILGEHFGYEVFCMGEGSDY